ncbi:hypothetical protein MTO96_019571 [Rhipicephalus appendiculatus]
MLYNYYETQIIRLTRCQRFTELLHAIVRNICFREGPLDVHAATFARSVRVADPGPVSRDEGEGVRGVPSSGTAVIERRLPLGSLASACEMGEPVIACGRGSDERVDPAAVQQADHDSARAYPPPLPSA